MPQAYEIQSPFGTFEVQMDHQPSVAEAQQLVVKYRDRVQPNPTRIGPAPPSAESMFPPDPNAVTLRDVMNEPAKSMSRMWTITKAGLSDPRNTIPAAIGIAAGATGLLPPSFAATRGMAAPETPPAAAPKTGLGQALKQNVSMDDVVDAVPGMHSAKAAYRVVRGVGRAIGRSGSPEGTPAAEPQAPGRQAAGADISAPGRQAAASGSAATTPPASAGAPASTLGAPQSVAEQAAQAPPAAGPTPGRSTTPSGAGFPKTLAELNLSPAETAQAVKWLEKNVPADVIIQRVLDSRQLTKSLGTATPDEAVKAADRTAFEANRRRGKP